MRPDTRDRFVEFAQERAPDLFRIAFQLTGRQDAAEKLLQTALEVTLLRWRRLHDPYAYAVRTMRRRSLPWWRRWQPLDDHLPAGEVGGGRVVDLTDLALTGARRRRLSRAGLTAAGVAAVVALAVAVPATLPGLLDRPADPDLTGWIVVASYDDGPQSTRVLDPTTGDYRPGGMAVSPDLRLSATVDTSSALRVSRTATDNDPGQQILLPVPTGPLEWAPDSTRIAAPAVVLHQGEVTRDEARLSLSGEFRSLVLVDVADRQAREVPLDLPEEYVGVRMFWRDSAHLAVAVADTGRTVRSEPHSVEVAPDEFIEIGGGPHAFVVEVLLVDLEGAVVDRLPVEQDVDADTEPDLRWHVAGPAGDGEVLLARHTDRDRVQLATLAADGSHSAPAAVTLADPPEHHLRMLLSPAHSFYPLPDGLLLLRTTLLREPSHPEFGVDGWSGAWTYEYHVVDRATDEVWLATIPDLPEASVIGTVGDAAQLAPAAAHRAFRP